MNTVLTFAFVLPDLRFPNTEIYVERNGILEETVFRVKTVSPSEEEAKQDMIWSLNSLIEMIQQVERRARAEGVTA